MLTKVNEMDTFREYIQKRQAELGLSQNEVAERAGKSGAWLSKFMSGERKDVKVDTLLCLSKALNVSPSVLIAAYQGQNTDFPKNDSDYREAIEQFLLALPVEDILKMLRNKNSILEYAKKIKDNE